MIVADTNLIGYLFISSQKQSQAIELLDRDSEWCSPILWRSEFRNVLAGYIRRKIFTLTQAQIIMDEALKLMSNREFMVASERVLSLVQASTCTAYDCEFVALAVELGYPLVTVDRQIREQFPEIALSPEQYLET